MKTYSASQRGPRGKRHKTKSLKSKVRDLNRLLSKRNDMDPKARQQFQEQIEDLNAQIASKAKQEKRKKLHMRYKGVKFVGLF